MGAGVRMKRWISLLLAATLLLGSAVNGRAAEVTEPQPAETIPGETAETAAKPEEAALPEETETVAETVTEPTGEETVPEETIPEGSEEETVSETVPEETEATAFETLLAQMELLEQEAAELTPETEVLDAFAARLREVWNEAWDAYDRGLLSEEEMEALDALGWGILGYLKEEYRYENGVILPLDISRYGSQLTPLDATGENSVTTLGSGSGIKFRIFNYTNGKDSDGNYITAGGINDNGLSGYFDFRGTSYENTGADGKQVSNYTNSVTDVDGYTANHAPVLPNLGSAGYPVFDGSRDGGPQRSLGYLFGAGGKGVTGYAPSNTLLRQNSRGQYYYNSADNAADFDIAGNRFIVRTYRERGKTTANQDAGQYYDFFPFTYWDGTTKFDASTAAWYNYNNTLEVDYWYGMTMEAAFSMPAGGLVNQDQMVFEFSGDDDVWVFIDGVLVLDLGGTHGVVSGSINFATGEVKQYLDWGGAGEESTETSFPTTLKARFDAAGKTPNGGWNGDVFANYTEHSIKFYYLERATSCANCKILFNMPILPSGNLTVEKEVEGTQTDLTAAESYGFTLLQEDGTAGAGIPFDRFGADGTVLKTGRTDAAGGFSLEAGQRAEFDLPAGKTYRVREEDPGQYAAAVSCTVNGQLQTQPEETGDMTIDPDTAREVLFLNRLKTASFTVRKQVEGNMGDRERLFDFRVRLYDRAPGSGGTLIPFPEGAGYAVQEGEAGFRLKHGTALTLEGIPIGAWAVVTEELTEGYETRYLLAGTETPGRTAQIPALTEPQEVLYTNTCEMLIDTGITMDTVPYLWMTAGSTVLLAGRRKRKPYE